MLSWILVVFFCGKINPFSIHLIFFRSSWPGLEHRSRKLWAAVIVHEAAKELVAMQGYKVAPKAPVGPDGEVVKGETVLVFDPDLYASARAKILNDL